MKSVSPIDLDFLNSQRNLNLFSLAEMQESMKKMKIVEGKENESRFSNQWIDNPFLSKKSPVIFDSQK